MVHFLRNIDLVVQNILIAELLDLQIAADVRLLFLHRDVVAPLAQSRAEEIGERRHHHDHLLRLVRLRQPDDRIQRIVEKMRIDLRLQKLQLH